VILMLGMYTHRKSSVQGRISGEGILPEGIVSGHAYMMIQIHDLSAEGYGVICEVRNPWGNQTEWNGEWSDQDSSKWSSSMQRKLNHTPGEDGCFWMSYEDMNACFDSTFDWSALYSPDWFRCAVQSEWNRRSAGGCGNSGDEDWARNPQFMLEIPEPPSTGMPFKGTLSLSQEDVRYTRANRQLYSIQVKLWTPFKGGRLDARWSNLQMSGGGNGDWSSGSYRNNRVAYIDLEGLMPGNYVVVCSTFSPGECCEFTLALWTSYAASIRQI